MRCGGERSRSRWPALICACAAVAIGKSLTPKYSATAQLYVDPRELQLVDRELTPRAQDISGLAMVVESQARVITSNNVLLQVIQDTHLDKDPEFGGESKSMMASLLGLFGIELRSAGEAKLGQMAALDALNRHITVKKTDRTFIVDIDVWSYDPAKAAMLANAITNAYLAESKKSQSTAARRATTDLSGRLKELQERLRTAENTLAVYKAQNNFVGTQDTAISDQQLSASNQRLAAARALTLDAQAKYDQIEASRRASTDAGAIPEALQSPTIANLRAQYAEARKRYAEMTGELGPLHPALRQMEKQVDDLRRTINEEVDRFALSAKNDLTRARDYEASLNKALDAQKRQSVQLSQASVRLRELERDVEASRDVYQSFLKRSRETEEQESLNTSNARIIGEATVPQRRAFPPAMSLLAMIGFMFGALAAASWVVAADRLTAPDTSEPQPARIGIAGHETFPFSRRNRRCHEVAQPIAPVAPVEKPLIARLQESDVMRTLGGILATGGIPDLTRMGWPTLRAGFPLTTFLNAMRDMRDDAGEMFAGQRGAGDGRDRQRRRRGSQHRRAQHRAGGRTRRRQGTDDRCRSRRARALQQGDAASAKAEAGSSRLAQHRQQGLPRHQDRQRNLDPAGDQGSRCQGQRCHPQGDRAGALRRRLRPRDPRRTGDALERRRPQAARYRRRPGRDPAGQSRHQRLHGRHHRRPRRRRAQAGRRRPQRTSPRGRPAVSRDKQYA